MSGGHYAYRDFCIENIASDITKDIDENEYEMSEETLSRMRILRDMLNTVSQLVNLADYLYSSDISQETFIERFDKTLQQRDL